VVWDDRREWTRPGLLPPEDPYEPGNAIALGAPDVYFNIINLAVGP
jgi:hypothetical protein